MVRIEVYVRMSNFTFFHRAMVKAGIKGITVWETRGTGRDFDEGKGKKMFRGAEVKTDFISRFRIETIVEDKEKDNVLNAIKKLKESEEDMGKVIVFISPVLETISF